MFGTGFVGKNASRGFKTRIQAIRGYSQMMRLGMSCRGEVMLTNSHAIDLELIWSEMRLLCQSLLTAYHFGNYRVNAIGFW